MKKREKNKAIDVDRTRTKLIIVSCSLIHISSCVDFAISILAIVDARALKNAQLGCERR